MENLYKDTAWLYDMDNRDNLTADIPFYVEYAKACGGEVLELGCGTGRVAMALAREGVRVTGLDLSPNMLDVFAGKLDDEPQLRERIELVYGDMVSFDLGKKFGLIIAPFRVFQGLTEEEDIASCLACIREHLSDDGAFIINVFKPYQVMDESWCYPEKIQWERVDEATGRRVTKYHSGDKIDADNQIIYPSFRYEVTDTQGVSNYSEKLKLKYYYQPQLEAVIRTARLFAAEKFGWYDKSTIEQANRELIFVCKRAEIRQIIEPQLPQALDVIRRSFITVSDELGYTRENCLRLNAFMELDQLQADYDNGVQMYGYFVGSEMIGFIGLLKEADNQYEMRKLSVLPDYRHSGIGRELVSHFISLVKSYGGGTIKLSYIDENTVLKNWYLSLGFTHIQTKKFDGVPYTIGYMQMEVT